MRNATAIFAALLGTVLAAFAPAYTSAADQNHTPSIDSNAVTGSRDAGPSEVRDLQLSRGGTVRVLYAAPTSARAALVMLPGGTGKVGIGDEGNLDHDENFVVRTRAQWLKRGYALILPDALDGQNMRGQRSSPEFADLVGDLVRFAHSRVTGPVFLLGTSQGTIAAMNGASQLSRDQIAGVVLTESISRPGRKSRETVFDAMPNRVEVPALLVANRDSRCRVAPAKDAHRIADAMTHASEVKVLYVRGGDLDSRDCGSRSPHGYWGIEKDVVSAITAWLDAHR